jgi:hypothetical protein
MSFIMRRPGPVAVIAALSVAPIAISEFFFRGEGGLGSFLANAVFVIVYMGSMGAMAFAASDPPEGELSTGECLKMSFVKLPTFCLIALIAFLAAMAAAVPLGVAMAVVGITSSLASGVSGGGVAGPVIALGIGFFGVFSWIYVTLSLTVQACVMEDLGAMASFRRSAALTKGHRLKLFGLYFLLYALALVPVVSFAVGEFRDIATTMAAEARLSMGYIVTTNLIVLALNAVLFPLMALAYKASTAIEDSASLDDYSEVF